MAGDDKNGDVGVARAQGIAAVTWLIVGGSWSIYHTANPPPGDYQAANDLFWHPIASICGGLAVVVALTPVVYWIGGRSWRRIQRRIASKAKG